MLLFILTPLIVVLLCKCDIYFGERPSNNKEVPPHVFVSSLPLHIPVAENSAVFITFVHVSLFSWLSWSQVTRIDVSYDGDVSWFQCASQDQIVSCLG